MKNVVSPSNRLIYRPFQQSDLGTLHALANEASCRRWFYFLEPDCLTRDYWQVKILNNRKIWAREVDLMQDECNFAIVLAESGTLIGTVGLAKFHGTEELDAVEIGCQIGEAYQGNGYATEAVKTITAWGLRWLSAHGQEAKIVGKMEHDHIASRKVIEAAGYEHTGDEKYVKVYTMREVAE